MSIYKKINKNFKIIFIVVIGLLLLCTTLVYLGSSNLYFNDELELDPLSYSSSEKINNSEEEKIVQSEIEEITQDGFNRQVAQIITNIQDSATVTQDMD